jgi:hypothetical protein
VHVDDELSRRLQPVLTVVAHRRPTQRARLIGSVELEDARAGDVLEARRAFLGDGLTTGEHATQRREVVLLDDRRLQHHEELRAHAGEHGDAFTFDGADHVVGIEAFVHDGRHAEDRGCDVRRPEPEAERRRDRAQEHVVTSHVAGLGRELVEVHPAVLRVHDALRHAGGARRRVDDEHVVGPIGAAGEVAHRRGGVDRDTLPVDDHVVRERTARALQHRHELGRRPAPMLGQGEQRVGTGEGEQVADLVVARAMSETDDGEASSFRGHEGNVHRDSVGQQHREPGTSGQSGAGEHAGQSRRPVVVVGPGGTEAVGDDGVTVAAFLCPLRDGIPHGRVAPPPRSAVSGGDDGVGLHPVPSTTPRPRLTWP